MSGLEDGVGSGESVGSTGRIAPSPASTVPLPRRPDLTHASSRGFVTLRLIAAIGATAALWFATTILSSAADVSLHGVIVHPELSDGCRQGMVAYDHYDCVTYVEHERVWLADASPQTVVREIPGRPDTSILPSDLHLHWLEGLLLLLVGVALLWLAVRLGRWLPAGMTGLDVLQLTAIAATPYGVDSGDVRTVSLEGRYPVKCECGCLFAFPQSSRGEGWANTATDASAMARREAAAEFVRDLPLAACPRCGRFPGEAVDSERRRLRKRAVFQACDALGVGVVVFVSALVLFHSHPYPESLWEDAQDAWTNHATVDDSADDFDSDSDTDLPNPVAALALGLVGLGLTGRRVLRLRRGSKIYDPNLDPKARQRALSDVREVTEDEYHQLMEKMLAD